MKYHHAIYVTFVGAAKDFSNGAGSPEWDVCIGAAHQVIRIGIICCRLLFA
jgi:hypothetical protein